MGLGVLNVPGGNNVPGTIVLEENDATREQTAGLKHGTGSRKNIVLAPQPSEDPNDPLNWSRSKKYSIIAILILGSCLCAATISPLLNASLVVIAEDFKVPVGSITLLSGYQLLVAGCSGPFVSALSRKYGKRPLFLFASSMGVIGSIIGSCSNSLNTLLVARVIQGFAISAYESIIFSVVGDIFFVHERGFWTSAVNFILGSVSNFSSVICGPITANLGWHYLFHLLIVFVGIQLILTFLFVPETTYHRDVRYETDMLVDADLKGLAEVEQRHVEAVESKSPIDLEKTQTNQSQYALPPAKKTFVQSLAVYTGIHSDENLLQLVIAPVACTLSLSISWFIIIVGGLTSFYVAAAYVIAQIFFPPPYLLTASGVGYLSLGPFIGSVIAVIMLSLIMDPLIIWMTKRNHGIYEPEFRLVPALVGVLTGVGLIGFGYVTQAKGNLYVADFLWGLALFGAAFTIAAASAYVIDAFRDMSSEIFIAAMMFKNFLFYGYSYFVNEWTAKSGPAHVFNVFGGVGIAIVATVPLMYVFGKRYRSFWQKHNTMKALKIRTHSEM